MRYVCYFGQYGLLKQSNQFLWFPKFNPKNLGQNKFVFDQLHINTGLIAPQEVNVDQILLLPAKPAVSVKDWT